MPERLSAAYSFRYISPRYTIRPDGRYLIRYEILHALRVFATALVVPGYCYLVLDWPQLYYVMWLFDLAAYFDMLVIYDLRFFQGNGSCGIDVF